MGDAVDGVLPDGTHRGWSVRAVQRPYLKWFLESCDLRAEVRRAACDRLGRGPGDYRSTAGMRSSYRPMVRAVLRAAGLLAPEVFEERTPGEYACDPAAMVRLADVVGALARVHLAAARHGVAVVSPSPPSAACGRQYSDGRSSPDVVSLGPPV